MCDTCGLGYSSNFENLNSVGDQTNFDIWSCLTCGFNGCGNKNHNHILRHYQETLHNCAINLADKHKVFDFNHDNFVDRIRLSDSASFDRKETQCEISRYMTDPCSSLLPCLFLEYDEDLVVNSKLEKLAEQYQQILIWRMNQTRLFYDKKLKQVWDAVRQDPYNQQEMQFNQKCEIIDKTDLKKNQNQSSAHQWTRYIKTSLHNEHAKLIKQVEVVKNKILELQNERETLRALNKQLKLNNVELSNRIESDLRSTEHAKSFGRFVHSPYFVCTLIIYCYLFSAQIIELESQVSNLMHALESDDQAQCAPSSSRSRSRKLMLENRSCAGSD